MKAMKACQEETEACLEKMKTEIDAKWEELMACWSMETYLEKR
jgi:hypothetical protein